MIDEKIHMGTGIHDKLAFSVRIQFGQVAEYHAKGHMQQDSVGKIFFFMQHFHHDDNPSVSLPIELSGYS
jgi:hypothetical protein